MSPLLDEAGEQVTKDADKAQVLNNYFASDFSDVCLQQCQLPQTSGTGWSKGRQQTGCTQVHPSQRDELTSAKGAA